jgi:hypothetical protein
LKEVVSGKGANAVLLGKGEVVIGDDRINHLVTKGGCNVSDYSKYEGKK